LDGSAARAGLDEVFIRALLCSLIIIAGSLNSFGQQGNPFELKNRVPSRNTSNPDTLTPTGILPDSVIVVNQDSVLQEIVNGLLEKIDTVTIQGQAMLDSDVLQTNPTDSSGYDTSKSVAGSHSLEKGKEQIVAGSNKTGFKPAGIVRKLDQLPLNTEFELDNRNVLFGVTLLTLLFLASLLAVNRSLVKKAYRAIANDNYLRFLYREYKSMPWLYWLFYAHFFINAGFFIFLILDYFDWYSNGSILVLLLSILFVASAYLLKHLTLSTVAAAFPVEKEANLYGFVTLLVNILLGLALLPINLLVSFGPESIVNIVIWIGISLVILLYGFRQLKGLFISGRLVHSYLFHFFLYLCSAEIAPLLIVGKLALGNFGEN
jgi:hypothetical protein